MSMFPIGADLDQVTSSGADKADISDQEGQQSAANQRAPRGQSDQSEAAISSDDHHARNKREKEVWYLKMN